MNSYQVSGSVQRFPGKYGWYYVPLPEDLSSDFREIVRSKWPALLGAELTLGKTTWNSSIMPIKDDPLFIALPEKVRNQEKVSEGSEVQILFRLH